MRKVLTAARKKYGDELVIVIGYTAPHVKIAQIARELGITVHAILPALDSVNIEHLTVANEMAIASASNIEYIKLSAKIADSVMSLDKGDPIAFEATKLGKKVWYIT